TSIVSPGWAASIAACRLPPALTEIVAAVAGDAPLPSRNAPARGRPTEPNFFKGCSSCANGEPRDWSKWRATAVGGKNGPVLAIALLRLSTFVAEDNSAVW